MAESVIKSYFPSQVAPDLEKTSPEYGMKVAKAIEQEWFRGGAGSARFYSNQNSFHKLRLYARGEQPVQKYKDELAINGDLSYLNLDWKPVPIIPKFVDIVVNGNAERSFKVKAYSIDEYGVSRRTKYMESLLNDMTTQELAIFAGEAFGINIAENNLNKLPRDNDELELHMMMDYKDNAEVASEEAINKVLDQCHHENIRKRNIYDLVTIGIASKKTTFNTYEGIKVEYVDPANLVYSFTEDPFFGDIYYVGEIKIIPINELRKLYPYLNEDDLKEIQQQGMVKDSYGTMTQDSNLVDSNSVQILFFNYKTFMNEVYKVKELASGASKVIVKDENFNPPEGLEGDYEKVTRPIEVLFEGAMVVGTNKLLDWKIAPNMVRPKSDYTKVYHNYSIVAPRMYKGRIESIVQRITGFGDMIQLTHLKLQQVLSRMVPDGIYLDADGLAEIDLGNGTKYNPAEALNMFFQTGSVIGRSFTSEGDINPGKVPVQEIQSGSGNNKIQSLIATYNYYLQMIRDVTGLNEAVDGSKPDRYALVGVQKLAAANSNTATRHILQSDLFLTAETADKICLRVSDVLEYSPMRDSFIQSLGVHNVAILEELAELSLRDFAIYIELAPDDEEKAKLEENIQIALSKELIELDDAIDIREIKNLKIANQVLKLSKRRKLERDQQIQQANIQAQAQANAQQTQAAAQAEIQKQQYMDQGKAQFAQLEYQLKESFLGKEKDSKKELMMLEFELNQRLQAMKGQQDITKEGVKAKAKSFESNGNDVINGGIGLGSFEPR